ncbi:hypothetical protein CROQUDRAFT_667314 [Cronartium quercuum f. sp. fusiforme G11]|uniref:Dilute domain-containing protein n=1 Tax=Cronartium quercuum f. sp. fusiforme G11 TaxID=708437 RepID=A0A9P6NS67_9BASI|nr:hypothetical protein CROQUDRAFT_667314 [Cronartium quercuum f. sp. fusiforme G11]
MTIPPSNANPCNQSNHANYLEPDPNYIDPLISLAPTPRHLSNLVRSANSNPNSPHHSRLPQVFTAAFLVAASSGDSDLIEWLLAKPESDNTLTALPRHSPRHPSTASLPNPSTSSLVTGALLKPGEARQLVNLDATDEDGTPPIILAAAFGHAEAVRAIVDGIGGEVIDSRDAVGWTALHWAARNGDFTIVSYLLNHGAATNLVSYSEQNPSDGRPSSLSSASRLSTSSSSTLDSDAAFSVSICADDSSSNNPIHKRARRSRGLRPFDLAKRGPEGDNIRHVIRMAEEAKADAAWISSRPSSRASIKSTRTAVRNAQTAAAQSEAKQLYDLALLSSRTLGFNFCLLGIHIDPPPNPLQPVDYRPPSEPSPHTLWEEEQRAEEFDWERCLPDQMLVCSIEDLPVIFDAVISLIDPQRPRTERFMPANVIFLSSRFAAHFGTDDLLEELLLGAIDRIEEVVLAHQDNMAYCAFWLFNSFTLLYYIQRDPHLHSLTREVQMHLQDLINEIFVFIIRDAERRLDKILDQSMLEFQSLTGFEHVEFESEGSWNFVKALTVKRNRPVSLKPSLTSFLSGTPSPLSPGCPPSHLRSSTHPAFTTTSSPNGTSTKSPRTITELLSSVLYLLQAYEIHPSVTAQAFSQLFYWLACELFNRIITRRKYLCRSRAIQIRINLLVLEDWARDNRLPSNLVGTHFKPIHELLHWLQTLSANLNFDELIEALASLPNLNPHQILKAYREYRFEVDEPKLAEEGRQYLVQMQQDWDRRRLARKEALEERESAEKEMVLGGEIPMVEEDEGIIEASKAIDTAFKDSSSFGTYCPPKGPDSQGELLDSRHMLPFTLPSSVEALVSLSNEVAFGPFKTFEISTDPLEEVDEEEEEQKEVQKLHLSPNDKLVVVPVLSASILARLDLVRERHRKLLASGGVNGA